MSPSISIVTTAYNLEEYIGPCIDSVIGQTYKKWEMIIVDDNSSDSTVKIINFYRKRDKRIKLIRHKKRLGIKGVYRGCNEALRMARGEYIAMLDGDDFWPSYKLKEQLKVFSNKEVVLSYGDAFVTRFDGTPVDVIFYKGDNLKLNNDPIPSIILKFSDFNFYLETATVMLRKDALIKAGGFQTDPNYPFPDVPTWFSMSFQGKFAYQKKILGFYRRHKDSFWFNEARMTKAMYREEIKRCYWSIVNRNLKVINKSSIEFNKDKIIVAQNSQLKKKTSRKGLSIFLHLLIFGNTDEFLKSGNKVLKDKSISLINKLIILLLLRSGVLRNVVLEVQYQIKLTLYRLHNLVS